MTIFIEEITIRNLGPLTQFDEKLGKINLIYGHNERGKTLLVEFIIQSLFKNSKIWSLREIFGEGGVSVSGLEEETIKIKPKSAKKLEDYWELSNKEFPKDMSKLLVVRAAEVELSNEDPSGIGKQILLKYLSGKGVINSIQKKIKGVLKSAKVKDGKIIGAREQGIKKDLSKIEAEITRVEEKFEQVNTRFSQGRLQELRTGESALSVKFEGLRRAKRHAAFTCHQKSLTIKEQLSQYPQSTLDAIGEAITRLVEKKRELERMADEYETAKDKSTHYAWLKQAIELYEKRGSLALPKHTYLWLVMSGICLAVYLVLMYGYGYGITAYWMGALLIGLVGGTAMYILNQNKLLRHRDAFEDINDIKQAYKEKFGATMSGLSALKATREEIDVHYFSAKTLKESLERIRKEIVEIKTDIINYFLSVIGKKVAVSDFDSTYADMKIQKSNLEDVLGRLDTQMEVLGVPPEDFFEEVTGADYTKKAYEETRQQLVCVREQISKEDKALEILKQSLCVETGNKISDDWDEILENLRLHRNDLYAAHKSLKAQIIAQILVNQSLEIYRAKEDENIREGLRSEVLLDALQKVTGRYNQIELVDDGLIISDGFGEYSFSDLSTGAQEQIFLALRIGFAAKISKNDSLFFILDDAFQYSDWDRRELLVDKMIDLAKNDWQIIYFSMDDHIRDIFVKKATKEFKDNFKLIVLDD